jgi:hypothetical protein
MVIGDVPGQDVAQVSFAQDEHVVETLAPDGTDRALGERILPGAVRRREDFGDPHALDAVAELLAIHLVTVAQEVGGRRVVWERGDDLLRGPDGGGVLGRNQAEATRLAASPRTDRASQLVDDGTTIEDRWAAWGRGG